MQINIRRKLKNWMQMEFQAISENEQLARIAVASFITPLDPTLEEMADVMMYYTDTLLRYHIAEEEISEAYVKKYGKNMGRDYTAEYEEKYHG